MNKIVVLSGGAASGKDTILRMLAKEGYKPCVSHTTRPKRVGEVDGRDYYFTTVGKFASLAANDAFVETRSYPTKEGVWLYGMSYEELDKCLAEGNVAMVLDIQGLMELKESKYKDMIVSFYISVDENTRLERYLNRDGGLTLAKVQECARRFVADRVDFCEAEQFCDYTIKPLTSEGGKMQILEILGK